MDVNLAFKFPQEEDQYESAYKGKLYREVLRELPKAVEELGGTIDSKDLEKLIAKLRIDKGLKF